MIRPLIIFLVLVLTAACSTLKAPAFKTNQAPAASHSPTPCALPVSTNLATDNAKVFGDEDLHRLEQKLQDLKMRQKVDFAVVIVNDTAGQDIFDYSLGLANCWGVGANNPDKAGVLLMVAVKDRKWRIQITRELEKVLTNAQVQDIGNLMVPDFKQGNYPAGVNKAVDSMIDALTKRRVP